MKASLFIELFVLIQIVNLGVELDKLLFLLQRELILQIWRDTDHWNDFLPWNLFTMDKHIFH